MNSFAIRASRAPLAILIAFALVVSGIISASPQQAAHAAEAPAGHTPNEEIAFSNIRLTRQDPTPGRETQALAGPLRLNQNALFQMNWTVKPGAAGEATGKVKEGDSFYVQIANAFELVQETTFPLIDTTVRPGENVQVGTCYPQVRRITCVFSGGELQNTLAANKTDFSGTLTFAAKVIGEIDPAQTVVNGNGVNTDVPLPDGQPVKRVAGTWSPAAFKKGTDGLRGGRSQIRWYVTFNPETLKRGLKAAEIPNTPTFTDTLEGSHIHDDKYELYINQTKQNPDMRQADWVTVATNSTRLDGKKSDAVAYGTFDVKVALSEDKKTATYTITKTAGEWDVNANYKFLYYTFTEGGPAVEDVLYSNSVTISDGVNAASFNADASFTAQASATSNMADGYGSFKIAKVVTGKIENIQPGTKVRVNVGWTLPNNKTAAEFPEWTAPANPFPMELTLGESREYPLGGNKAFPVGTVITLTEDPNYANPALPAGIKWDEPIFNIQKDKSHREISFSIAEKSVTRVGMVNTAIENRGAVSVGDLVWFDTNKDGKQDEGEPGIAGVELTIYGPDGKKAAVDADGKPYNAVATTGDNGKYLFENLPVLKADTDRYTVEVTRFPHDLTPTTPHAPGISVENDSSRIVAATVKPMKVDGREDRTLDFGFVNARVSVGDLVWFDTNKDGKQDEGEPGIAGVELTLTGPKGKPVADVDGKVVGVVKTDKDGRYKFGNLPVLGKGERYTVTVSQAPVGYAATTAKATGDKANDSSTTTVSSSELLKHGDKDLTLDFGFVKAKESVKAKGNKVAKTGADAAKAGGLAALIVLAGAAALVVRRRMTH